MSTRFDYLFIIICIFVLNLSKKLKITNAAAVNYNDYNYLDTADKNFKDYVENFELNNKLETSNNKYVNTEKRNTYELNNNDDNYPAECKPPFEAKKAELTSSLKTCSTTASPDSNQCSAKPEGDTIKEAQDVIEHITNLIKSMREHSIALIKNMNELETDILASSPDKDDSMAKKNGTCSDREVMYDMEKITNSDVVSQTPGYVINEWAAPVKIDLIPGETQTNDFMEEAQAAVKSWKQQIETCKRILDNAVIKALENSSIKSNIISDTTDHSIFNNAHSNVDAISGQQKQIELNNNLPKIAHSDKVITLTVDQPSSDNFKEVRSNAQRKYHGLYDTLHGKYGGY